MNLIKLKLMIIIVFLNRLDCYNNPLLQEVPSDILKESLNQINIKYNIPTNNYLGTYLFQKVQQKTCIYNLYLWFKPNLIFRMNVRSDPDSDDFKIRTIDRTFDKVEKAQNMNKYRTSFYISSATTIINPFLKKPMINSMNPYINRIMRPIATKRDRRSIIRGIKMVSNQQDSKHLNDHLSRHASKHISDHSSSELIHNMFKDNSIGHHDFGLNIDNVIDIVNDGGDIMDFFFQDQIRIDIKPEERYPISFILNYNDTDTTIQKVLQQIKKSIEINHSLQMKQKEIKSIITGQLEKFIFQEEEEDNQIMSSRGWFNQKVKEKVQEAKDILDIRKVKQIQNNVEDLINKQVFNCFESFMNILFEDSRYLNIPIEQIRNLQRNDDPFKTKDYSYSFYKMVYHFMAQKSSHEINEDILVQFNLFDIDDYQQNITEYSMNTGHLKQINHQMNIQQDLVHNNIDMRLFTNQENDEVLNQDYLIRELYHHKDQIKKVVLKQKKVAELGELDLDLSRVIEIDDPNTVEQLFKLYIQQHSNEGDESFNKSVFDIFKHELNKEDPLIIYEIQQNIRNLNQLEILMKSAPGQYLISLTKRFLKNLEFIEQISIDLTENPFQNLQQKYKISRLFDL